MGENALVAVALLLVLVGAVGGFVVGWIARRDENRRYLESRERFWSRKLAEAAADHAQELAEVTAPAPTVVHVHMPAFPQGQLWPQPRAIDAPVDLDAMALGRGA